MHIIYNFSLRKIVSTPLDKYHDSLRKRITWKNNIGLSAKVHKICGSDWKFADKNGKTLDTRLNALLIQIMPISVYIQTPQLFSYDLSISCTPKKCQTTNLTSSTERQRQKKKLRTLTIRYRSAVSQVLSNTQISTDVCGVDFCFTLQPYGVSRSDVKGIITIIISQCVLSF